MQGLDLFCKIFVDPGDLVIVESPDLHQRQRDGAVLRRRPAGDPRRRRRHGRRRARAPGRRGRAAPPRRSTRSRRSRTRPASRCRWSAGCGCSSSRGSGARWCIDDDPYGMLRFEGEPVPTLRELGGGDPLVFSVRTFSKIVAPGLRVGWVDTVPELQPLLINAKQAMDTCTNLPAQRLLTGFLTGGHLDDHLATQRAEYRRRKEAMHAALREHFGDIARWTDPEGGFFCWVTLRQRRRHHGAVRACPGRGRRLHPGLRRSPRPADSPTRCGCASPRPRPTGSAKGVARLRRAVDRARRRADRRVVSAAEPAVLDKIDEARAGRADPIAGAGRRAEPARRGGGDGRRPCRGGRRARARRRARMAVRPGRNNLRDHARRAARAWPAAARPHRRRSRRRRLDEGPVRRCRRGRPHLRARCLRHEGRPRRMPDRRWPRCGAPS